MSRRVASASAWNRSSVTSSVGKPTTIWLYVSAWASAPCRRADEGLGLLALPAQAEDAEEERREEDLHAHDDERGAENGEALLGEAAEPTVGPDRDDDAAHGQPDEDHRA